jgi:hypothetical protein
MLMCDEDGNERQSAFEILHYAVGASHTAEGAWLGLVNRRKDVEDSMAEGEAVALELMAEVTTANKDLAEASDDYEAAKSRAEGKEAKGRERAEKDAKEAEAKKMESMAILRRTAVRARALAETYAQDLDEHRYVSELIELIAPMAGSPKCDRAAFQSCQRGEILGDIVKRIENALLFDSRIPPELMAEARAHPDFTAVVAPMVAKLKHALATPGEPMVLTGSMPWMSREGMESAMKIVEAPPRARPSLPPALAGLLGPSADA